MSSSEHTLPWILTYPVLRLKKTRPEEIKPLWVALQDLNPADSRASTLHYLGCFIRKLQPASPRDVLAAPRERRASGPERVRSSSKALSLASPVLHTMLHLRFPTSGPAQPTRTAFSREPCHQGPLTATMVMGFYSTGNIVASPSSGFTGETDQ